MQQRSIPLLVLAAFLLLLSLPTPANASAGLSFSDTPPRSLIYAPGASYTWTWGVSGADRLETTLTGDLAAYATLDDPAQNTSGRSVSFTLTMPANLTPGQHFLVFTVYESPPEGQQVGGRAAAAAKITVTSLYPTPYLVASLSVPDTAAGKPTTATVSLTSWSTVPAPDVYADILVRDANGTLLIDTPSEVVTVAPQKQATLTVPLTTQPFATGRYQATAVIHHAQDGLNATTQFRVGSFDLSLISSTPRLSAGTINRFSFTLGSNWNEPISGVYGDVSLGAIDGKTATVTIDPFGQATLDAYLDTSILNLSGNETPLGGTIIAHFLDTDGNEQTKAFPFNVTVVNVPVLETQPEQRPAAQGAGLSLPLGWTTLLYIFLILLVIINLILLFRQRRGKDEGIEPPGMRR